MKTNNIKSKHNPNQKWVESEIGHYIKLECKYPILVLELDFGTHREPFAKVDYSKKIMIFEPTFEADFDGVWQEYQEYSVGYTSEDELPWTDLKERAKAQGAKLVKIYQQK